MDIDLLSVARFAGSQPHDQFAWLRSNAPVYRHEEPDGPGFWAVTRYDDVKTIGRDSTTFSSMPTIMLDDPSGPSPFGDHVMMLMADPPVHTRMRRLISSRFTPRAAKTLGARVAELATAIVDDVIEQGRCDLVTDLAGEMPSFVIADVLGIPLADGRELYHCTEALHSSREVMSDGERQAAMGQMFAYSQKVYTDKKDNPTDDLASLLAHGVVQGPAQGPAQGPVQGRDDKGAMPVDEVDFFLWFLLLVDAGGDTTRNLVGGGWHALFEHPTELARLRSAPEQLLDSATEELLRWVSPVIYMRRTATTDTVIAGQDIAAGDKVVMYYGSANRDEACVEDPDRFDLGRNHNPHVAFGGGGPHFCLGAHLARLEIKALVSEMLRRLDDLAPVGEPTWMGSNFIYGPTSLPVTFAPGPRLG